MRWTFRAKLMAIVGTAALAFVVLVVASTLLQKRSERELTNIKERYLPRVGLGPQLEGQFERIRRGLQDAVAAHDAEALDATREQKKIFLDELGAARNAVDPSEAEALRIALEDYYSTAREVSRRLIAGETGETLVGAMTAMQSKQAGTEELLKRVTSFDSGELAQAFSAAAQAQTTAGRVRLVISVGCLFLVILLSALLSRGVLRSLAELATGLQRFGKGNFESPIPAVSHDELGDVARQANQMAEDLKRLGSERDRADWLKSGHARLAQELRGELTPSEAANRATRSLASYLEAPSAALYYRDSEPVLRVLGQYAEGEATPSFRLGEGLVGQAALQEEMMVVSDPPADYLRVRSGLGNAAPRAIVLVPLLHVGRVTGVLELALFKPWSALDTELLLSVRETLAIAIEVARARAATRELLAETQQQALRLANQEDELRASNDELRSQQEELRQTNEELTQQAEELRLQRGSLQEKNAELDETRRRLEQKAEELTTVSAYKSQFLANMSHELRTPLNSMLLLSNLMAENETGNLTDKQVEFSKTIHSAGKDLLALINQVLDLAKVESGKQEVRFEAVPIGRLVARAQGMFEPLARDKGLRLVVEVAPGLPETLSTDSQRLDQIINNLLANAIKFTSRGEVSLRIHRPEPGVRFRREDLDVEHAVALAVSDTGVGIAPENQERIFAPFEQVEATPDRRYGGTGLGLTISRQLASLLGGELQLRSTLGRGSTFICYLPWERPTTQAQVSTLGAPLSPAAPAPSAATTISLRTLDDDRATLQPGDAFLLIVEDDPGFAAAVGEIIRQQGMRYLVALDGHTGLRLARERRPSGIILDIRLPYLDGWRLMEELRKDPSTAEIPVHFLSAVDAAERGMALGAVGYVTKPATRADLIRVIESLSSKGTERKLRILVVEADIAAGDSLLKLLAGENIDARQVTSASEVLATLQKEPFDCIILDVSLPITDGIDLLQSLEEREGAKMPSIVVYTGRPLNKEEAKRLEAYAEAVVLKEGASAERLLDEIRLFVRRFKAGLAPRGRAAESPQHLNVRLDGRRVLVVDDDMRTLYALSAMLRSKGAQVFTADTGLAALGVLNEHPDVEAVLMDVMMPEMDGYEAMRRIRQDGRFPELPVIALTAKAMKGDEKKCIEAGASDYLSKPIDADRLIAVLQSRLRAKPT